MWVNFVSPITLTLWSAVFAVALEAREESATCHLHADEDPHFFKQSAGYSIIRRSCAPGTIFSAVTCSCSDFDNDYMEPKYNSKVNRTKCQSYFHLAFHNDVGSNRGHVGVGNRGVKVLSAPGAHDGMAGFFDGHSRLKIWALNDMEFGDSFALSLRFKLHQSRTEHDFGSFALADNSGCGRNATFGLAVGSGEHDTMVYGGLILGHGEAISRSVPVEQSHKSGWHDVLLMKDGDLFVLKVDGKAVKESVPGNIKRQACELRIGEAWGLRNFKGFIDDVEFFKCIPPKWHG